MSRSALGRQVTLSDDPESEPDGRQTHKTKKVIQQDDPSRHDIKVLGKISDAKQSDRSQRAGIEKPSQVREAKVTQQARKLSETGK
jgi:hypothetical protein